MQEAQKHKRGLIPKKSISRHIIFKMQKIKDKEKILKEAKGGGKKTYAQTGKGKNNTEVLFKGHANKNRVK